MFALAYEIVDGQGRRREGAEGESRRVKDNA